MFVLVARANERGRAFRALRRSGGWGERRRFPTPRYLAIQCELPTGREGAARTRGKAEAIETDGTDGF